MIRCQKTALEAVGQFEMNSFDSGTMVFRQWEIRQGCRTRGMMITGGESSSKVVPTAKGPPSIVMDLPLTNRSPRIELLGSGRALSPLQPSGGAIEDRVRGSSCFPPDLEGPVWKAASDWHTGDSCLAWKDRAAGVVSYVSLPCW